MKATGTCPKCRGTNIAADAKAIDRTESFIQLELTVSVYGKPDAAVFKDKRETALSASVCSDCGYVELYADHPKRLRVPHSN